MKRAQATTLFCEDAREEVSGATTLVGVVTDTLTLPSVPSALPKLIAYFRVIVPIDLPVQSISTWLRFPDGSEQARQDLDATYVRNAQDDAKRQGAPTAGFINTVTASPFMVPAEMRVLAITAIDGEESVTGCLLFAVKTPEKDEETSG
jgi:hypothetical protein